MSPYKKSTAVLLLFAACCCIPTSLKAQQKIISKQNQAWVSINTTARISNRWGFVADVHMRRNHFFADPSFYFLRGGVNYWFNEKLTATLGYARMWVAPAVPSWQHYAAENRIYQQLQVIEKTKTWFCIGRLRNEQRWQQKIVDDQFIHQYKFTDRVRLMGSANRKIFGSKWYPSLVCSDEIAFQFGKEVVYNTFDQNRLFVGLKQNLSKSLSADVGYMWVYQQLPDGAHYYSNRTFRLFFYYMPDWRTKK